MSSDVRLPELGAGDLAVGPPAEDGLAGVSGAPCPLRLVTARQQIPGEQMAPARGIGQRRSTSRTSGPGGTLPDRERLGGPRRAVNQPGPSAFARVRAAAAARGRGQTGASCTALQARETRTNSRALIHVDHEALVLGQAAAHVRPGRYGRCCSFFNRRRESRRHARSPPGF